MKTKNLILLVAAIFISNKLAAQNILPYALAADSLYASQPFYQLDTNILRQTDLLLHKRPMNLHWPAFKGAQEDSALGMQHPYQVALDARKIALDSNLYPDYHNLVEREAWLRSQYNANPLLLYHLEYDAIRDSSFLDSSVFLNNSGILEHQGFHSPFIQQKLFALSANFGNLAINDSLAFIISDTLFISNISNASIANLKIDLKDGQGLSAISFNQVFYAVYSESQGLGPKIWELQAELNNGQFLYAKLMVSINGNSCSPPSVSGGPWGGTTKYDINGSPIVWEYQFPPQLTEAWNGQKATGNTYVWYRKTIAPGEEGKFRKPIILVEGIDFGGTVPGDGRRPNQSTHMGNAGWPTMWDCDDSYPFDAFPDFLDSLHDAEYDIIMLDFHNGVDYIQRNGLLLTSIIKEVNNYKLGNEPNVILGASMGGQVARYALVYMEHHEIPHCTGLFASLDSPWKGAHIPLAIQWFIHTAAVWGDADGLRLQANINSPAAKQMLRFHYTAKQGNRAYNSKKSHYVRTINYPPGTDLAPDPHYTALQNEIALLGDYPKKCRNIALVNGNVGNFKSFPNDGQAYVEFEETITCLTSIFLPIFLKVESKLYAIGSSSGTILKADRPLFPLDIVKVFGAKNLDNVPGSLRPDISREVVPAIQNGVWNGLAANSALFLGGFCTPWALPNALQAYASFVPTTSALNLETGDLFNYDFTNLEEDYPGKNGDTHFDAYTAPANQSMGHVKGTQTNLNWLKNQIYQASYEKVNPGSGVLTNKWNIPLGSIGVPALDVNAGGRLMINADEPRYDLPDVEANYDAIGGLVRANLGGACFPSQVLNINSGAKLELGGTKPGTNSANNQAYLYIGSGAQVNINLGSELRINPGSKLIVQKGGVLKLNDKVVFKAGQIIVEDGGELIIERHADFNFAQFGSSILIQGKLSVKAGATIKANSNGVLIFDQDIPWITVNSKLERDIASYLEIEPGAKLHLIGLSPAFKNQCLLEIRKETILKDAQQNVFDEIIIQNGVVSIAPNAFLFVASPISIIDAELRSSHLGQKHGGLRIWNNTTINYLRRVTIKDGNPGVLVSGPGSRGYTEFRDCVVRDNYDGLKWSSGKHIVRGTQFTNNIRYSVYGLNLNARSEITSCTFSSNPSGGILSRADVAINLQGQEGSSLKLANSTIDGFLIGLMANDIDLRASCNTIQNNLQGISLENAIGYLNDEASNTFRWNSASNVYLQGNSNGSGIYLRNGGNLFDLPLSNLNSQFRHIVGNWYCYMPYLDYSPNYQYADFNFNKFQTPSNINYPNVGDYFELSVLHCSNPFSLATNIPVELDEEYNSVTNCNNAPTLDLHPTYATLSTLPETFGKVSNGQIFNQTPIGQALDQALSQLSFGEEIRNDKGALETLIAILQGNINQHDANTQAYLNLAYNGMHQALNQAYQQNQLQHNAGEPVPPVVELNNVIGIVDDLLLPLSFTDSLHHAMIFQLHLDKVHAFRVAGHYNEAISVLSNRQNWTFDYTQSQRAGYWNCVCEKEEAYFTGDIRAEEFDYGLDQCRQSFAGYTYKRENLLAQAARESENKIDAYPQPVKDVLSIKLYDQSIKEVELEVYSAGGYLVKHERLNVDNEIFNLDMSELQAGLYLIHLDLGKGKEVLKVFKY